MARDKDDKSLGMHRAIARRDFLNGVALGVGGTLLSPRTLLGLDGDDFAPEKAVGYYPPALTGLRGSHPGSFEAAHDLKDGFFEMKAPLDTGEAYDLVVVGAGISGLSAAHFFRKAAGSGARVLILDNHDDFGGHARRNEFQDGGRLYVTNGGTLAIDSPAPYSAVAKGLISELGIDVSRWEHVLDREAYAGLSGSTFFDKETFGEDKLVKGLGGGFGERRTPDPAALQQAPLREAVRRDILRLETESFDPWPGVPSAEKKARLLRMSYADFVTQVWKLDPGVLPYYQTRGHGLFGVGIDAICALDGWGLGLPGFEGLKLEPGSLRGMNRDAMRSEEAEDYFFHYPDGNATVARLLLRKLIPAAVPGATADDAVLARADYAKLDEAQQPRAPPPQQHGRGRAQPGRRRGGGGGRRLPARQEAPQRAGEELRHGLLERRHPAPVSRDVRGASATPSPTRSRCPSSTRASSSATGRPSSRSASAARPARAATTARCAWTSP